MCACSWKTADAPNRGYDVKPVEKRENPGGMVEDKKQQKTVDQWKLSNTDRHTHREAYANIASDMGVKKGREGDRERERERETVRSNKQV